MSAAQKIRTIIVDDEELARRMLLEFLAALKAGRPEVRAPVYSHLTYDIVEGDENVLTSPDIVIVEGVNVLQTPARRGRPVSGQGVCVSTTFIRRLPTRLTWRGRFRRRISSSVTWVGRSAMAPMRADRTQCLAPGRRE